MYVLKHAYFHVDVFIDVLVMEKQSLSQGLHYFWKIDEMLGEILGEWMMNVTWHAFRIYSLLVKKSNTVKSISILG